MRASWQTILIYVLVQASLSFCHVSGSTAAESAVGNFDWRRNIEKIVEEYIRARPEIIEQALQALEKKREAEEPERVRAAMVAQHAELLSGSGVAGERQPSRRCYGGRVF